MHTAARTFAFALGLTASVAAPVVIAQQPAAPPTTAHTPVPQAARCGDVTGNWSPTVNGLRGRLITSGSRPDHSALRVVLELQNLSTRGAIEIHWEGSVSVGFARYGLDLPTGAEVPPPNWALGGNEASGKLRELIPNTGTVQLEVASNLFANAMGGRIVRVGAFWAREMPTRGEHRFFRASVNGQAPAARDTMFVDRSSGAGSVVRQSRPADPRGRPWIGTLDIPAVCVD